MPHNLAANGRHQPDLRPTRPQASSHERSTFARSRLEGQRQGQDDGGVGETKADLTAEEENEECEADGDNGDDAQDESDGERRKEEKGKAKAVADTRDQVSVIIRMSNTSRDLKLDVAEDDTVRSIVIRVLQRTGVSFHIPSRNRKCSAH